MKQILGALLALIIGLGGFAAESELPVAAGNEFIIEVRLETADEVCTLLWEYSLDGETTGTGGVCNADMKTPLAGTLYQQFQAEDFPEEADLSGFSIAFSLSGEFEGDEAIPASGEIVLPARYGENYTVVISGDRENGYRAS
ncbi:MAG: hypothetical protein IKS52_05000 [Clostridia bacterium]|nr:hypothetical protein [Clostridia bacterium]